MFSCRRRPGHRAAARGSQYRRPGPAPAPAADLTPL